MASAVTVSPRSVGDLPHSAVGVLGVAGHWRAACPGTLGWASSAQGDLGLQQCLQSSSLSNLSPLQHDLWLLRVHVWGKFQCRLSSHCCSHCPGHCNSLLTRQGVWSRPESGRDLESREAWFSRSRTLLFTPMACVFAGCNMPPEVPLRVQSELFLSCQKSSGSLCCTVLNTPATETQRAHLFL